MSSFTVAMIQARPPRDRDEAAEVGQDWCRRAAVHGADLALFPELWDCGYRFPAPGDAAAVAAWRAGALAPEAAFLATFRRLAHELGMAIALTYLAKGAHGPRNVVTVIDRQGNDALTYAKVHTCEFGAESLLSPGDGFPVAQLDTAAGQVKIGAMICFDREHPESARLLMLGGAEVIVVPNACELEGNRLAQIQSRAYENMVGIAVANYVDPENGGHSVAFDGMAFAADETTRDMRLALGGREEELLLARFDLVALRQYRSREVWGNAYRHPELYGALTAAGAVPPFVRPRRGR